MDPHAEERVHGDVHMTERCETDNTMFVGSAVWTRDSLMDLLPSSD